jgi:signal transduction histidine kinase
MRIRTKFTLWISLVSLSTTIVAAFFVYVELLEEPYKLIDRELYEVAGAALNTVDFSRPADTGRRLQKLDYHINRYWFKIIDSDGKTLFSSSLAGLFDIPRRTDKEKFFFKQKISPDQLWIDPGDLDELNEVTDDFVNFRVVTVSRETPAGPYAVVIAKPLLFFDIELQELRSRVAWGICVTVVLVFLASYFLAGRMLRPISTINHHIRMIREQSLDRRIPPGDSRDELHVLSTSLNMMFDRLQYSFTQQKEFIGNAAHELKSPLTILMLGHEELLAGDPPEKVRQELEKQLNTMRRLSRLVRDLLDISRLEQGETCHRQPVRLDQLIGQVVEEYQEMLQARRIAVEVDTVAASLAGDPEQLLRLLINLIDNAIKYNLAADGRIVLRTVKSNGQMVLTVANTGQTIPAADLPRIFDQFYRVEKSRSQAYGGSGLGLTIVKRIVELHGGSIEAASQDDWTTFTITLPDLSAQGL